MHALSGASESLPRLSMARPPLAGKNLVMRDAEGRLAAGGKDRKGAGVRVWRSRAGSMAVQSHRFVRSTASDPAVTAIHQTPWVVMAVTNDEGKCEYDDAESTGIQRDSMEPCGLWPRSASPRPSASWLPILAWFRGGAYSIRR